jgi:choline dehydrogenase-like flavoprotein
VGRSEIKLRRDARHAERLLQSRRRSSRCRKKTNVAAGEGIHEMVRRMGTDRPSVLNAYNQAHDVPNLFITDGSFMTSASCVNPSLNYMAFTARACDYAVKQLAAGAL